MANSLDQKSKLYAIVCLHLSFEYKRVNCCGNFVMFDNLLKCSRISENVRECCSKEMFDFNEDEANSKKRIKCVLKRNCIYYPLSIVFVHPD